MIALYRMEEKELKKKDILLNKGAKMEEAKKIIEGTIISKDPVFSFEAVKNSRGYNWTIKVRSDDIEFVKAKAIELDKFCKDYFV